MRLGRRHRSGVVPKTAHGGSPAASRNRLAALVALVTMISLGCVFLFTSDNAFLMPGPLQSGHRSLDKCSACHTKSGEGKLSWLHGLVAGDPLADSKACLLCHRIPDTAFNSHSASVDVLRESTERLARLTDNSKEVPLSTRVQNVMLPTRAVVARGIYCATCHQEHRGADFDLKRISDEKCRSCHVVKFDSFDGRHPKFDTFPFRVRTRIIFDHTRHFRKHYPDVAEKEPAKRIPETCSTCHNSTDDRRIMSLAPFDETCSTCHLGQITGEQRASGPKGIAFLSLPGIDQDAIRNGNGVIGEWPEDSQAELTPFMKVIISRTERGRAILDTIDDTDLQDLAGTNSEKINAVADLVWEIKSLLFALISGKTPDVFGDLKVGKSSASPANTANLTAGIPRDVLIAMQQQYLPNLALEIAKGPGAESQPVAAPTQASPPESPVAPDTFEVAPALPAAPDNAIEPPDRNPQTCLARFLGQCLLFKSQPDDKGASRLGGPRNGERLDAPLATSPPTPAPGTILLAAGQSESAAGTPQKRRQTSRKDNLLFPTPQEQRAIDAHRNEAGRQAQPVEASSGVAATSREQSGAPIGDDVDAESWAEHGGWYQQDHAIYYRPARHKDRFIYTWLALTGPFAPAGAKSAPAAVFDALTAREAQGACSKCHSVDSNGQGRYVNFSPLSGTTRQGRLTRFVHEPHIGTVGSNGCLTCHNLEKNRHYLKSYEQGNPRKFEAEFGAVKIDTCQQCHNASKVRQDCLLCHAYHANKVVTPSSVTKLRDASQF